MQLLAFSNDSVNLIMYFHTIHSLSFLNYKLVHVLQKTCGYKPISKTHSYENFVQHLQTLSLNIFTKPKFHFMNSYLP